MSQEQSKLNPVVRYTTIGIRVLKEVKVYPLSVKEQMELTEVISDAIRKFQLEQGDANNLESIPFVLELIKNNLGKIMSIVSDEQDGDILSNITNEQLVDLAEIIYEMNFGSISGKIKALIGKIKGNQ